MIDKTENNKVPSPSDDMTSMSRWDSKQRTLAEVAGELRQVFSTYATVFRTLAERQSASVTVLSDRKPEQAAVLQKNADLLEEAAKKVDLVVEQHVSSVYTAPKQGH